MTQSSFSFLLRLLGEEVEGPAISSVCLDIFGMMRIKYSDYDTSSKNLCLLTVSLFD